jgi:hypothetical protein
VRQLAEAALCYTVESPPDPGVLLLKDAIEIRDSTGQLAFSAATSARCFEGKISTDGEEEKEV